MNYETTLRKIWRYIGTNDLAAVLRHRGKTEPDDEPLPIRVILNTAGLMFAIKCLSHVRDAERDARMYAVWCARQSQHLLEQQSLLNQQVLRDAINVAEMFAKGDVSQAMLLAAYEHAEKVAYDAAYLGGTNATAHVTGSDIQILLRAADAAKATAAPCPIAAATNAASSAAVAIASDVCRRVSAHGNIEPGSYDALLEGIKAQQAEAFRVMFCTDAPLRAETTG
jgi:hypothetical protein